jgi:hypothetical protein
MKLSYITSRVRGVCSRQYDGGKSFLGALGTKGLCRSAVEYVDEKYATDTPRRCRRIPQRDVTLNLEIRGFSMSDGIIIYNGSNLYGTRRKSEWGKLKSAFSR